MRSAGADAFARIRKAAERGHVAAQRQMAWMFENGRGVERDHEEAVWWYWTAAEGGDAHAQNRLGEILEEAPGEQKNVPQAIAWYRKAADRGDQEAKAALESLDSQ